ncbi:MAG TPA: PD-(D/E)XK nuclease family protein, partial [Anaeromyxobacteraceae bacterium]|nr:PD-(D/E)XK nuclease family protein [Anaeromyxobacteraceae bacterium]
AAGERLVLVRWRLEGAAPTVPHPLADEIAARFAGALTPCAATSEAVLAGAAPVAAVVSDRAPAGPIAPRPLFRVEPGTITIDALSPSSLEKLLGCPVAWVLERTAGLRRRGMARIPSGSRLLGTFAHAILADLLDGKEKLDLRTATPDDAAAWAERSFDARVPSEAAPLVARGADVERHRARDVVRGAARALFAALQAGGWSVRGAETPLEGELDGSPVAGTADLVVEKEGRAAVLDLKLAKAKYFREKLENGEALQLAVYADLLKRSASVPPTAYFLLAQGELLTVDAGAFPGARELAGPTMSETLERAREALAFWRDALAKGVVVPRDEARRDEALLEAGEAVGRTAPQAGPGGAEPPCRFCDFG